MSKDSYTEGDAHREPDWRAERQRQTLRGLGLTRSGKTVDRARHAGEPRDDPKVAHLVRVEA